MDTLNVQYAKQRIVSFNEHLAVLYTGIPHTGQNVHNTSQLTLITDGRTPETHIPEQKVITPSIVNLLSKTYNFLVSYT